MDVGDSNSSSKVQRWVHIDLKGAPPLPPDRSSFWDKWCDYIKNKGNVEGLVLEFENVLDLSIFNEITDPDKHRIVYTKDQVKDLIGIAKSQGLQIIPLVQTFGHLEFLLKHKPFFQLREHPDYSDSLQPAESASSKSLEMVRLLLDQTLSLLNDMDVEYPAIHLGGDEVWHLGHGERSKERLQKETRVDLFLKHMTLVIMHVQKNHPEKRILMWDDMLRAEDEKAFLNNDAYRIIRESAELVVWQYTVDPGRMLPHNLFSKYSSVFSKRPWVATSFKGASSSCGQIPDLGLHVGNHLAWCQAIDTGVPFGQIDPQGFIITGWQRFDHYASLCELIPVSIPSLRCCFEVLDRGKFTDKELETCFQDLGLQNPQLVGNEPKFPGADLYVVMTKFVALRNAYLEFQRHDTLTTWVNDWQIANKRVSRLQSDAIIKSLRKMHADVEALQPNLGKSLANYFHDTTVDEWVGSYYTPIIGSINKMIDSIKAAVWIV